MGKNKQTKMFVLMAIIFGILFALPLVNSAVTLNTPTTGGNYTTLTFNCTKLIGDAPINATTMWVFYNASGGTAATQLGTSVANDTENDVMFTGALGGIESLTDGASYNFTCQIGNSTVNTTSAGVKSVVIDNTAPTSSLVLAKSTISVSGTQDITWTNTDATSGVQTVLLTITSPNVDRCPTYTSSSSSSSVQRIGSAQTSCEGTYTVDLSTTDYAGNSLSETQQSFKAIESGRSGAAGGAGGVAVGTGAIGANLSGILSGILSSKVIVFILLGIVIYFGFIKKKHR